MPWELLHFQEHSKGRGVEVKLEGAEEVEALELLLEEVELSELLLEEELGKW